MTLTIPLWPNRDNVAELHDLIDRAIAAGITYFEVQSAARRDLQTDPPNPLWVERYLRPVYDLLQYITSNGGTWRLQVMNPTKYPLVGADLQNYAVLFYPSTPARVLNTHHSYFLHADTPRVRLETYPVPPSHRARHYTIEAFTLLPGTTLRIIDADHPDSKLFETPLTYTKTAYPVILPEWVKKITIMAINESGNGTLFWSNLEETLPPATQNNGAHTCYLPHTKVTYRYLGELKPDGELPPYSSPCASADFTKPETADKYLTHFHGLLTGLFQLSNGIAAFAEGDFDVSCDEPRMLMANPHSRGRFQSCGYEWAEPLRILLQNCDANFSIFVESGIWEDNGYHACNTEGAGFKTLLHPLVPFAGRVTVKLWGEPKKLTLENYLWIACGGFRIQQTVNLTGDIDAQFRANKNLYRGLPFHARARHSSFHLYTETVDQANIAIARAHELLNL